MKEPDSHLLAADQTGAKNNPSPLVGDILHGADEIAEFLFGDKKSRRKVYNLVETARLPVFRLGVNICARKSVLLEWISAQERKQAVSVARSSASDAAPLR